jgi:D-alanyl-D-alanine carboxypeptidase
MKRATVTRRMSRGLALAVSLGLIGAAPAAAHDPGVSIQAEHAAVFDPLYPMGSGSGVWSRLPDDQTRMASTTKTMTADVVLELVKQQLIDLEADVTISANAAGTSGSSLDDINGIGIRTGEVIRLRDLLYGLMIPSGNNAAVAIAEHVTDVLYDDPDVAKFADLMNLHAETLGLADTFYTNPAGFANSDAVGHHTSARDLARLWHHAMADATFRDLVRPRPLMTDAWTFTGTTATGATTNYSLTTGAGYTGALGWKNGGRNGCGVGESNDTDAECFVMSARRLGRTLVAAAMQSVGNVGNGTGDTAEIMDLAYARLFHPDYRGGSPLWGAASRHALACPAAGKALSAVLPATGTTRLASWGTNVTTKSYTKRGTGIAPSTGLKAELSTSRDVDLIALTATRAVTATRVGTNVELRLWNVPASGAPTVIGSAVTTRSTGFAKSIELVRLSDTMFASAALTTDGRLALKSWRRTSTGLVRLDSRIFVSTATPLIELEVARSTVQQLPHFITLATQTTGDGSRQSWEVDPLTGAIDLLASGTYQRTTGMSLVPVPELDPADLFPTPATPWSASAPASCPSSSSVSRSMAPSGSRASGRTSGEGSAERRRLGSARTAWSPTSG